MCEPQLPIAVQVFLWRQLRPFIRAKLGRVHEASCVFCQHAPGHHEMKEACMSMERVLVQNIHNELTPSLKIVLETVPRWRLIQASFSFVLHATANLLNTKKDFQNLGPVETTFLYILHWIILDAAEECIDQDRDFKNPFYYLFSIPSVTLFVYLFIPLCSHLKDIDFKNNLRLENGQKIWYPIYEYHHPEVPCFTALCRSKSQPLWRTMVKTVQRQNFLDKVFLGSAEDLQSQNINATFCDHYTSINRTLDDNNSWVTSPKDKVFPETIPEESSSTEDEHVVIFTLPSLEDSGRILDGVKEVSTIFAGEASIFHVALGHGSNSSKSTLTIEQVTGVSDFETQNQYIREKFRANNRSIATERKDEKLKIIEQQMDSRDLKKQRYVSSYNKQTYISVLNMDLQAATFFDVAVIKCLFTSQWQEEGVFWALQFLYNRLRKINENVPMQQIPRERSHSLPIPKIEISIYENSDSKQKYGEKEDMEEQDTQSIAGLTLCKDLVCEDQNTETNYIRQINGKSKRRMKIADLKAFVETKLLSKSEKALEKIGEEFSKSLLDQEYHRSLDAEDATLTKQQSIHSKQFDKRGSDSIQRSVNLIKGKSMPSLRYIDDPKVERKQSQFYSQSYGTGNPIITVTEHTPVPSPDYIQRQDSMDSQLDTITNHARRFVCDRKRNLSRSQTDSNISYITENISDAPGSDHCVTKEGDIDLQIILKALHSVALRNNQTCTLRVCEAILNLIELLVDMGIFKHCLKGDIINNTMSSQDSVDRTGVIDKKVDLSNITEKDEGKINIHNLIMHCIIRMLHHLGCPNGCSDGIRGPQADFCRSQIQTILTKLQKSNSKEFSFFLQRLINNKSMTDILDFFHSYMGFCIDPGSLLSPSNQKRSSKSPDTVPQGSYATNFGAGLIGGYSYAYNFNSGNGQNSTSAPLNAGTSYCGAAGAGQRFRNIESQIMSYTFKLMVTRCVKLSKDLKSQGNISLYCDLRQFMTYVKEVHGGIFRRVVLSCMLDAIDRPNRKCKSEVQTTKVIRHMYPFDLDQSAELGISACYTMDDKGSRKFIYKKRSTSSTCASLLENELSDENTKISQSPIGNLRKKYNVSTSRQSEKNFDLNQPFGIRKTCKASRLKIGRIVNWFRKEYGQTESTDSHESSESPTEYGYVRQLSIHRVHHCVSSRTPKNVSQTFKRAKRRVEDKLYKIGLRKGKQNEKFEEVQAFSRKNSFEARVTSRESEFVLLKQRRLVPRKAIFEGIQRFSFLLEICQPGSVPDHQLLAAVLDLPNAPVAARAALLLECAYLVHQCNKGHWPIWMKLNYPMFRPSMALNNRSIPSGVRRTHLLQRTAGKLFYQWAEVIGLRLEEFLMQDKQNVEQIKSLLFDDTRHRDLIIEDEEEDFLDEVSINTYGSQCPIALRLVACALLLEITTFLRETYQTLPKSSRLSTKDRPAPWEKLYSREANRRWSMALSSMGHSQTSAQSLQSIAGDKENERKISFVLHEPDNESEGSSKSNVTIQGEEMQNNEKEKTRRIQTTTGRPFLLRRGTAGNTATGSFKRRSLKLRRGTKEGRDIEIETFRRADSIQSKRKVSSLSDRSDTSEPGIYGEISGEESPGILSDDQPPESPSDSNDTDETTKNFPWMKTVVQVASNFNFYCCHQHFCHPYCYRRQMRASERLIKAVRKIYGEEFGIINKTSLLESDSEKKENRKKIKRNRKISDQASAQDSPIRRRNSIGRKNRIDKNIEFSQPGDTIGRNRNSSKDLSDPESIYGHDFPKTISIMEDDSLDKDPHPMIKYIKNQVKDSFHSPLATLLKGAVVISEHLFVDILPITWQLLLETNQEVAASAASLFIVAAVRAPTLAIDIMQHGLKHSNTAIRINTILKFQVLWKCRYQVWPRMEEPAHLTFKVPPPGIEFTLPSPKIGIESLPVVDPPWMPQVKTKVEEVTINQERHRALVTATKTRKKQQTELIKKALQAQDDKKREERENFLITTIPITFQAAYEPSPIGDDHDEGNVDDDGGDIIPRNLAHHGQTALSLFPSTLCSAIIQIISLLDDAAVSDDGNAVYEIAYQVIWNCLVEDSALFLRYVLERLTRDKQNLLFKILRHLIRFVPKLPQQAAFALYNYIIGYVMFYVRSPHENGQKLIGTALSILWMVVHSVHGIMFKDLKQILRKEQCDASILLTANVPSAKKIIVHGPQDPDAGGIPSQFPVQEDTQFCQILRESLDFFGIEELKQKEYFLVDYKTRQTHNPSSYVRDYYFFKRSQYPQLELVHMKPEDAFNALQQQELVHKFVEIGKVLLTWAILKNVDMVVQRVVFLHEELMKLPSFPRKALEADLDLYKGGTMGRELLALDVMHKFMWVRLIARMFEAMAGNFAYSGDIHLFLNVLNGALVLHSEDSCILRYVVATYINAAHNFKNIFSTNGYFLIMPSLLQLYSTHQTNKLVTTTVEYAVKQFYLMNRKPFILQMFGSVSAILDTDETNIIGEAHKVPSSCLFNLLLSLETPSPDPLNIGELVKEEKPLKAIDFCYHDENEMVTILDCISLCVMVISYAADSIRGQQMLTILEAIMPCYVQRIQLPSYNKEGKTEKEIINQLAIAVKTLVNNSEALTKYYNRPQKISPEHKGSSQKNYGKGPYSPGFDFDEETFINKYPENIKNKFYDRDNDNVEIGHKNEFIRPRDTLLNMVGEFVSRCSLRLYELNKKSSDGKIIDLLDSRCHIRLADIAHSLLKISPYDADAMACRGLKRYMNYILPSAEWSNDDMRPTLIIILRRLDKTFNKIYKKTSIRRNTNWNAARYLLKGVYETLRSCPYIAHFQYLKTLINTCQSLLIGDTTQIEVTSSASAALMSKIPPQSFCSTVLRLIALQVISLGEGYTLENVCGGHSMFVTAARTENVLLNLLIPLFLRVGTGKNDVPKLRQSDVCFALTAVLNTLWPSGTKTMQITTSNLKTSTDIRTGSLTFAVRDSKTLTKTSLTLYQVAFLALKIIVVCFESDLTVEWPRILRTMKLLNKRNEASLYLWNFLEFIVSHRSPLFIQMLPFIIQKIGQAPISDHERNMQNLIRERIHGYSMCVPKSRALLLSDLLNELTKLKEEMENRKFDEIQPEPKRSVAETYQINDSQLRTQRPSLLIDLLTGDLGSRAYLNRTPTETPCSYSTVTGGQQPSSHHSMSSTSNATKTSLQSQISPGLDDNNCQEVVTSQLSPNSLNEDSSSESRPDKPRLQRSMGQSKRTFRLRKSRHTHLQVIETSTSLKTHQQDLPSTLKEQHCKSYISKNTSTSAAEMVAFSNIAADSFSVFSKSNSSIKHYNENRDDTGNIQISCSSHQQLQHQIHYHYLHVKPQSDISWDEDTSSTSGYKESYSLQLISLESNGNRVDNIPPLASPDLPSTSSTTTNYMAFDGSSPECSVNSNGGEKTALLTQSSQYTNSQHSLIMTFQTQDEDTLI